MREEFIRELYEKYFGIIVKYCLPRLRYDEDAAADCAHAVFDEALAHYDKLCVHENVLGWLMNTAKYKLRKRWSRNVREAARNIPLELAASIPDGGDPLDAVELDDAEIARITMEVLSSLKDNELEIYRLYYVDKLSFEETANRLGISEKAARARLARVKAKLKNRLIYYL